MMWERLDEPWRGCVEEAWTAYRAGSLPIGAVITDRTGTILARGRNRIGEGKAEGRLLCGHRLAHAELNALIAVDWAATEPEDCVLYTTTEPCPLCAGAVRMARLRDVRYASRDGVAGAAALFEAIPYMRQSAIAVTGPTDATLEVALLALLVEWAMSAAENSAENMGESATAPWWERFGDVVPAGLALGQALRASGNVRRWSAEGRPASFVIDELAERLAV
jgi:tRNA(adenine34) deaminase